MQLAEVNLAWMRYPLDDPKMAAMREEIDRINALGDNSPGFIWRFRTAEGNAIDVRVLEDPRVLFNLSILAFRRRPPPATYIAPSTPRSLRRRRHWFLRAPKPPLAMWWVPARNTPDRR